MRTTQVVKLIPRLKAFVERGTTELALSLWHKRVRHVFQFLDKEGAGSLADFQVDFFNTAMMLEFPGKEESGTTLQTRVSDFLARFSKPSAPADLALEKAGECGVLMKDFWNTSTGRRAYQQCLADIRCMKESCAIVEKAISSLTLKVCVLVLTLLLLTQLLDPEVVEDKLKPQGLHQLNIIALDPQVLPTSLCDLVRQYASDSAPAALLLMSLDGRPYWRPGCECCEPNVTALGTELSNPLGEAERVMKDTGLEVHELNLEEVAADEVRSLAVFDIHLDQRAAAQMSLLQTIVVVTLLMTLILYFAHDMKKLSNENVLHPLWDLMDDMCSMKSIEILMAGKNKEWDGVPTIYELLGRKNITGFCASARRCECRQPIPVADELLQLRAAFDKLQTSMLSWSKYVPVVLLKQVLAAGVESKIECQYCEVSVFFCDIAGFRTLCKDMKPSEVLDVLSEVHNAIYEALDTNGGTLLEFIGDEMLAIFNAPKRVPNHSKAAVTAMVEAMERAARVDTHKVRIQASVHKATVLVGNIGAPTRMKYGVLGDGVNLTARLKSLNTRYGTQLLVSEEAMDFANAHEMFVTRPIGNLVLKGRTVPTLTYEILSKRVSAKEGVVKGADEHRRAFDLYQNRRFVDARNVLLEANEHLSSMAPAGCSGDQPSQHLLGLCDRYIESPPPDSWDGSEHLTKKAW